MEYSSSQARNVLVSLRNDLTKQIAELQKQVEAIDVILPTFSAKSTNSVQVESVQVEIPRSFQSSLNKAMEVRTLDHAALRGMTQKAALKAIARAGGGLVRTLDAKELMVDAGVVKNTKNAYKMVFNLLKNTDEFRPTGTRGEYRMVEAQRTLQ